MSSRIPGFYKLDPDARLDALASTGLVAPETTAAFREPGLSIADANVMVENVISTFSLPNAVAVNFLIDGRELAVPMVVEEPSVVAACTNMAKLARAGGGFTADSDAGVMIGQVQVVDVTDPVATASALESRLDELAAIASEVHPRLHEYGGGFRGLEVRVLRYEEPGEKPEDMVVLHFFLDCADAMGANMVNTIAETLAPHVESITGHTVGLRILSNLADRRLARARVAIPVSAFGPDGACVADAIASAWRFAWADPYRAATHNKGVMNGIDAVCLATGNDWRAVEAGVHAFASRDGQYRPVTRWRVDGDVLHGSIEVPLQVGTIGGPIRVHPRVQHNLALLGVSGARELAGVMASVGLAQNLGALKALATEGIQAGHMRMHARTVAAAAGAEPHEVAKICARLCRERDYSVERARQLVRELRDA
ncbi:MAG: hydroxymethylglutaryl-CoA reductase, degradative [Myxococcales bacterium]|nr:hydroxymethylglutaryl-CoA reductase, degradative [Myxococcales bacterium]MCB9672826.1 hydroxymethylglutaryl-CoA reductase, degradative [Alphaproteobacteria bacterium]